VPGRVFGDGRLFGRAAHPHCRTLRLSVRPDLLLSLRVRPESRNHAISVGVFDSAADGGALRLPLGRARRGSRLPAIRNLHLSRPGNVFRGPGDHLGVMRWWAVAGDPTIEGCGLAASVTLEILHFALVLFGGGARGESSQVAAVTGLGIHLPRIEAVPARSQFANHVGACLSLAEIGLQRPAGNEGANQGTGLATLSTSSSLRASWRKVNGLAMKGIPARSEA
jgi:hypothetical protein